jgi:hypothetical protein
MAAPWLHAAARLLVFIKGYDAAVSIEPKPVLGTQTKVFA